MINIVLNAGHTSGVIAVYGGREFFRAPSAPSGKVLWLDCQTCEPLLVPSLRNGFDLPSAHTFCDFLAAGLIALEHQESFDRGCALSGRAVDRLRPFPPKGPRPEPELDQARARPIRARPVYRKGPDERRFPSA